MILSFRDGNDPIRGIIEGRKSVLVVGMGASGIAAANILAEAGCPVTLNDKAKEGEQKGERRALRPEVALAWGGHPPELFRSFPLVVLSPGIPVETPAVSAARASGARVIGEMELAFRLSRLPWVAVTGSNGKSTTTTLVGLFAEKGNVPARVGGNLGTPAVDLVRGEKGASWIVVEVSSFQLETMETFRPKVALLLNISPDHLDRYRSEEDYARAKGLIFSRMAGEDAAVFNQDDPQVAALAEKVPCTLFPFSRTGRLTRGVCLEGDKMVIRDGGRAVPVVKKGRILIAGAHNLENAMAAAGAAHFMGLPPAVMADVLTSFRGLPHRMELVARHRGVPIYNDSKGTNVGATERSLEGMEGKVILIAGGKDKGAPYQPLAPLVLRKVRLLILLGEAAPRIAEELGSLTETVRVAGLAEAVRLSLDRARPGDGILFSPACSSFDMFRNFEERGEAFRQLVRGRLEAGA